MLHEGEYQKEQKEREKSYSSGRGIVDAPPLIKVRLSKVAHSQGPDTLF